MNNELINEEPREPEVVAQPTVAPPPNRVNLTRLLGTHLESLLRQFPESEQVRGLILQKTKFWIPDNVPPADYVAYLQENFPVADTVDPPATSAAVGYEFIGQYDRNFSGTCGCSGWETYRGTVTISEEELLVMAAESEDQDDFESKIREKICENDGDFGEVDSAITRYDDHEVTEYEDCDDYEYENLGVLVELFLSAHPNSIQEE